MEVLILNEIIIAVEGIIGVGKTTMARELSERLNYKLFPEPVNLELLKTYYEDQKRWAFSFQMNMIHKRYAIHSDAEKLYLNNSGGAIIDRGLVGDRVFAKMLMKDGTIHPIDWQIYEEAYGILTETLTPPQIIIFLEATPEVAFERIQRRARDAEKGNLLPLAYLKRLYLEYHEMLEEIRSGIHPWSNNTEIWTIDWNTDWCSLDPLIDKINDFYEQFKISIPIRQPITSFQNLPIPNFIEETFSKDSGKIKTAQSDVLNIKR